MKNITVKLRYNINVIIYLLLTYVHISRYSNLTSNMSHMRNFISSDFAYVFPEYPLALDQWFSTGVHMVP